MKRTLYLLTLGTALSAAAIDDGFTPYRTIIDRMPFGRPGENAALSTSANGADVEGGGAAGAVLDPETDTFLVVLVGYVFDVAPSFKQGMMTISRFFTGQNFALAGQEILGKGKEIPGLGLGWKDYVLLGVCCVIVLIVSIIQERHADTTIREMLDKKPFILRFLLLLIGVMAIIIFGIYGSGYAAADFVYMQF